LCLNTKTKRRLTTGAEAAVLVAKVIMAKALPFFHSEDNFHHET
jgi:hypothetical protein